jgi:metal-responsive CopG/Arc/MetJ family transcriptional regulator
MAITKSYSIPEDVAQFIDSLPKMERSKFVSSTLRRAIQDQTKQKALEILASIRPVDNGDKRSSVELVREARERRRGSLVNTTPKNKSVNKKK